MLGSDLLDKSAPGVTLTSAGDLVVNYARRLLSINDQILDIAAPRLSGQALRIGATGDFTARDISMSLACYRARHPGSHFAFRCASIDDLLREMREGNLDVAVWVSATGPTIEARHCWTEEVVWLRGATTQLDANRPVPLVSYGEECPYTRSALAALNGAGRDCEIVYVGSSIAGLGAAVAAGIGVMALPRQRANLPGVTVWEDAPLPKLPDTFCGIYVRAAGESEDRDDLADTLATGLRLQRFVTGEISQPAAAPVPTPAV
jgi:DNA-binding transcriptional LysR family regulator